MNIEDYCVKVFESHGMSIVLGDPHAGLFGTTMTPFEIAAESASFFSEINGPRVATEHEIICCFLRDAALYYADQETAETWDNLKEGAEFVSKVLGDEKDDIYARIRELEVN